MIRRRLWFVTGVLALAVLVGLTLGFGSVTAQRPGEGQAPKFQVDRLFFARILERALQRFVPSHVVLTSLIAQLNSANVTATNGRRGQPAGLGRPYAPRSILSRIGRGSSLARWRYWATGVSDKPFTLPGIVPAPIAGEVSRRR